MRYPLANASSSILYRDGTVLYGTADPLATDGLDGEFYLNTTTYTLFGPKAGGAWPAGVSIVGPQGQQGITGAKGDVGQAGTAQPTSYVRIGLPQPPLIGALAYVVDGQKQGESGVGTGAAVYGDSAGWRRFSDDAVIPPFDYYVDSVGGLDTNGGATQTTAFLTQAKAQSVLTAGKALADVRASSWREQMDIPANSVSVGVAGSGLMPVIDGADTVTTGWTQPDAVNQPNVWSIPWSRSFANEGTDYFSYWEGGVRPRYAANATTDLQANGGWFSSSLNTASTTIYIKAAGNPNSDGILRELGKRAHCINGHSTTLGSVKTGMLIQGPIELKRSIAHYGPLTVGKGGTARQLLLRDGGIHHMVTEGDLTEDVLITEYNPAISPSGMVAYTADGSAFDHSYIRCGALFPGGASRIQSTGSSAMYAHSSVGNQAIRNFTAQGCFSRGVAFVSAAAVSMTINGGYCEDPYQVGVSAAASANVINYMVVRDTTASGAAASGRAALRRLTNATFAPTLSSSHSIYQSMGTLTAGICAQLGNTYPATLTNCAFVSVNGGIPITGVSGDRCAPTVNNSIIWGARSYDQFQTGYVGDHNVFYFIGQPNPQFSLNGTVYGTLAAWQTASGQDANSVFLKAADQVSGNGTAFWLGVSSGVNNGPSDGDYRINPAAKVYKGDGTALTGTFADGTTPITQAGPQFHWDFNARAAVAGPPNRAPVIPAYGAIADMRALVEAPASWAY